MGFIINENITTSYGSEVKNAYITIQGSYHIGRKDNLQDNLQVNTDPQFLINNGYNYILYTTASIYINKQAYIERKTPIVQNLNVEEIISLLYLENNDNIYDFIYSKLKDKVNSMFNNGLSFTDDL